MTHAPTPAIRIDWDALPKARWDRLVGGAAAAVSQAWGYGEAMRALGSSVTRARLRDGAGREIGLAQVTVRDFYGLARVGSILRGPVWLVGGDAETRAEALRRLRAEVPLRRPRLLVISPEADDAEPASRAGLRRVMTGYSTATIDLRRPLAALRAAMKQKWRNRLAAAERAGVAVRLEAPGPGRYDAVLARETAQQRDKGYRGLPPAFVGLFHAASGAGAVRLATARGPDGAEIATMLFLRHGLGVTYFAGWSGEEGRRLGAHNLLLWRAIEAFRAEGLARLDLGGLDTETGAGLARFKLGAGGEAVTLAGAYV